VIRLSPAYCIAKFRLWKQRRALDRLAAERRTAHQRVSHIEAKKRDIVLANLRREGGL
jgi:hypothetical protein